MVLLCTLILLQLSMRAFGCGIMLDAFGVLPSQVTSCPPFRMYGERSTLRHDSTHHMHRVVHLWRLVDGPYRLSANHHAFSATEFCRRSAIGSSGRTDIRPCLSLLCCCRLKVVTEVSGLHYLLVLSPHLSSLLRCRGLPSSLLRLLRGLRVS